MTTGFYALTVAGVRREIDDAISLDFEVPPELRDAFAFSAGQHLTLRADLDGQDVRRNYSLCAAPHEGELRVAIKRVAGGAFSNWANASLQPGDRIEVMPPHGSFTWTFAPDRRARYVGFAGGSGITPILSLLKTALVEEPESDFTLLYGNRGSSSVMFLEELAGLKNRFIGRLQVYHFLEDEAEDVELFNGRLDADKVAELLRTIVDPLTIDMAFICGPGPMMDAAEAGLRAAGVAPAAIMIERFTVGPQSAAQIDRARSLNAQTAGFAIEITLEGRRHRVAFDPALGNILDQAHAMGLPAPFACKAGVCGTCRARVLSGRVEMTANYGLSDGEVAQGYVLTCQAVPLSDAIRIDYDA